MITQEYMLIAEKLATDTRLPATNDFTDCAQACLSEWLQLLMVIERIKANKNGAAIHLTALVELAEAVYRDPLVIDYALKDIRGYGLRENQYWNPQPSIDRRRLDVLHTFFTAMDGGQSQSVYLTQLGKNLRVSKRDFNGSQKRYEKIVCEIIPGLIDCINFPWKNLNNWRMHYPHEAIIRAMIFHSELIDSMFDLRKWIETPFQELKTQALFTLLQRGEIDSPAGDKKLCAAQISVIREKMNELIAIDVVNRINTVSASIGFSLAHPLQNPDFPLVAMTDRETIAFPGDPKPEHEQEVITLKFSVKDLQSCVRRDQVAVFYLALERAIESAMPSDNTMNFSSEMRLSLPIWDALQNTLRWTHDDFFMLNFPCKARVNATVMLIGVEFSQWLWKERRCGKLTTFMAAKKYSSRRSDITTTNSTVKQYYERMRSWCKTELASTVKGQLSSRAENLTQIQSGLLWPINIDLIRRYKEFVTILSNFTGCDIAGNFDVDRIISIAAMLREILSNSPEIGENELKKYLCEKFNIPTPKDSSFLRIDHANSFGRLEKLVELNIDIGWGEEEG
ncbi:hypothetical protein ACUVJH_20890 [Aeromonas veronii]|uniref:hypothetical protein n=1 Tax=Aeromonas TaxID=642 RepID=UPI003F8C8CF5